MWHTSKSHCHKSPRNLFQDYGWTEECQSPGLQLLTGEDQYESRCPFASRFSNTKDGAGAEVPRAVPGHVTCRPTCRHGHPEQCHRESYDVIQQGGLAFGEHERGRCHCDSHQWKEWRGDLGGMSGALSVLHGRWEGRPYVCLHHGHWEPALWVPRVLVWA